MTPLFEFIGGLLDGLGLLALALSVGGVTYALVVLRAAGPLTPILRTVSEQTLRAIAFAGGGLAILRCARLALKLLALGDGASIQNLWEFAGTQVFRAGLLSAVLAACIAAAALWVRRDPVSRNRWTVLILTAGMFLIAEAGLSHAVSRVEERALLMTVTIAHVLGAGAWAGGVAHLLLSWRLLRRRPEAPALWPLLVTRFSPLGVVSVLMIVGPGLCLAQTYVGEWHGLVGTGYGNMLLVKIALFAMVLMLAATNFLAARRWRVLDDSSRLFGCVPAFIEVEFLLAAGLLVTAATLAGFPPAVDVTDHAASSEQVWGMFKPKLPQLSGPELVLVEAPEHTDLKTGTSGLKEEWDWDSFNHNAAGVILLMISGLALFDRVCGHSWARHWPLLLVLFSLLIVFFANPGEWPLGPLGFLESLQDAEVVQHWLAAAVVFALGVFEWRARQGLLAGRNPAFFFPLLCVTGGIVLLTHSHGIVELKQEFLVQSTHVAMGLVAVLVGCCRWLELRLPSPHDRLAGFVSLAGMMQVGFMLLFYINPDLLR